MSFGTYLKTTNRCLHIYHLKKGRLICTSFHLYYVDTHAVNLQVISLSIYSPNWMCIVKVDKMQLTKMINRVLHEMHAEERVIDN